MPARLIVLGVDAASPILLEQWARAGTLPTIRALMNRGTWGTVEGVRGFFIGSTWPSFYTGLDPSGHGFYRIEQLKSGSYEFYRPLDSPAGVAGEPFWRRASDAGRRVAVLDVPLSRLDMSLNGIQTVEWGGHDAVFGFQASPSELEGEVLATVGAYPLPPQCDGVRTTAGDFNQFVSGLERAVAQKAALTLHLLEREEWDLFVQVFTETHCAGHQCWHIHDELHPAHDPGLLERMGDPLERVYRAVDGAVAAIVERAEGAHILLVSAHGMSHFHGASFLLPEILFTLGVAVRPPLKPPARHDLASSLVGVARAGWGAIPEPARELLRPIRGLFGPRRTAGGRGPRINVDVNKSKCFAIPNGFPVAGVRLNLLGREPNGVLRPGSEVDAFCEELRRDLLEIIDERSGRPLVTDVWRTDDLYSGAHVDALPDMLVQFAADVPTGSLRHGGGRGATIVGTSPKIGRIEASNAYGRTGEHVPRGLFVVTGPGVGAGRRTEPVSVMDFHPTICHLLGLSKPDVNGRVIEELAGIRIRPRSRQTSC